MKFTDGKNGTIAQAEPPAQGQSFRFDDHRDAPRGFGLRITKAGGKAFILKYSFEGKSHRKTIGNWPDWSLQAARAAARELRQQIDSGINPLDQERQRRSAPTVSEAVAEYVRKHVTGLASERPITRYFERDLIPALGGVKLQDLKRRDVLDLVEAKAEKTPVAARHLLGYTKGLLDWCTDREYIELNPAASIKPRNVTVPGRRNALRQTLRRRVLRHEEIRTLWTHAEHCGMHHLTALALKLTLLTGQRPGEVCALHESEIDGDTWVIPAERREKTSTPHRVPLTPLALEIIETARSEVERLSIRRQQESAGYVFEARPARPLNVGSMDRAVKRHVEPLENQDVPELGHWTPNDLRRTARTELTACGFPEEIAERVIGHGDEGIIGVYNQHTYDAEKRAALEAWERRLHHIAAGESVEDNVVAFRRWGGAIA